MSQISRKKATVLASPNYLFTLNEAALLFRKNRREFERTYIDTGKLSFVLLNGRKYIRNSEITRFLNENEYIAQAEEA